MSVRQFIEKAPTASLGDLETILVSIKGTLTQNNEYLDEAHATAMARPLLTYRETDFVRNAYALIVTIRLFRRYFLQLVKGPELSERQLKLHMDIIDLDCDPTDFDTDYFRPSEIYFRSAYPGALPPLTTDQMVEAAASY